MPPAGRPHHHPALDGMRGLAALAIVGYHTLPWTGGLWVGVDVFFVLSGFLITGLLLREWTGTGTIDLARFLRRRALRLVPPLLPVLAVVAVWASLGRDPEGTRQIVVGAAATLTYSANWLVGSGNGVLGHAWSLAIEEQFYVVWPLVALFVLRRRGPSALAATALAGVLAVNAVRAVLLMRGADATTIFDGTATHTDGILMGCAAAVAWRAGVRVRPWAGVVGAAALLLIVATSPGYGASFPLAAVAATVTVLALVSHPWRPLGSAPLRHLGRISYALYLWHYVVSYIAQVTVGGSRWELTAIVVPVSLLLAEASDRLVEAPIRRRSQRADRPGAAAAAGTPPAVAPTAA